MLSNVVRQSSPPAGVPSSLPSIRWRLVHAKVDGSQASARFRLVAILSATSKFTYLHLKKKQSKLSNCCRNALGCLCKPNPPLTALILSPFLLPAAARRYSIACASQLSVARAWSSTMHETTFNGMSSFYIISCIILVLKSNGLYLPHILCLFVDIATIMCLGLTVWSCLFLNITYFYYPHIYFYN